MPRPVWSGYIARRQAGWVAVRAGLGSHSSIEPKLSREKEKSLTEAEKEGRSCCCCSVQSIASKANELSQKERKKERVVYVQEEEEDEAI